MNIPSIERLRSLSIHGLGYPVILRNGFSYLLYQSFFRLNEKTIWYLNKWSMDALVRAVVGLRFSRGSGKILKFKKKNKKKNKK
ncbi:hypothetical protein AMTRI_Chr02g213870 [Amborella trichopoda]